MSRFPQGWGMLAVALVVSACVSLSSAQQLHLMQGINHPAGPQFGQPDVVLAGAGQNPLDAFVPKQKEQKLLPDAPKDALVDPDGRELKVKVPIRKKPEPQLELRREEPVEAKTPENSSIDFVSQVSHVATSTWLWTLIGCASVVSCGILPAYLLPVESSAALQRADGKQRLNLLLSFAVGSLLGDVFLHLLPESWDAVNGENGLNVGLWTIAGLLLCFLVEKCCAGTEDSQHQLCAVMNLVANFVDNFTHGLAVGGSFLFGLLTTFAILVHEIPHEISDFAILLRADFNRWSAIKAQLMTAVGGVLGAVVALLLNSDLTGCAATWILPFTAGGFLNIALAQILPDLLRETNPTESLKQLALILAGIFVMGGVNQLHFA